jgi:hypothetical protein
MKIQFSTTLRQVDHSGLRWVINTKYAISVIVNGARNIIKKQSEIKSARLRTIIQLIRYLLIERIQHQLHLIQ